MNPAVPPTPNSSPIALFAGKGELPKNLVDIFQSQNRPFVVLAFTGQTDDELVKTVPHLWLSFGEVGKALRYLKENHIQEIVMAGTMARPTLTQILPDWEGVKWLARIGKRGLGDDTLLKYVIEIIEEHGYRVVGPDDILQDLLALTGSLTSLEPDEQAWQDIERGVGVLSALSCVDVGQAVVVQEGLILGIEAIEGTDALLRRVGGLHRPGQGGILIKISKRQQESRVDLPTIGPETIYGAAQAGLRGIAFEAGRSLVLNRKETIELAEKMGLFLVGISSVELHKSSLDKEIS